jgi:hypothetical protein
MSIWNRLAPRHWPRSSREAQAVRFTHVLAAIAATIKARPKAIRRVRYRVQREPVQTNDRSSKAASV